MKYYNIQKILKPIFLIISVLIGCYLYFTITNNQSLKYPKIKKTNIETISENEINLNNAVFKGTNKDNFYIINAEKAFKHSDELYKLNNLNSTYFINKNPYNIVSDEGLFYKNKNMIYLNGNIKAVMQDCTMTTNLLEINFKTNELLSNSISTVNFNDCEIISDQFQIKPDNILQFKGNVKTKFIIKE